MKISKPDLKEFLDLKFELYNRPEFIETDPVQIPHQFTLKEDIEIAGFLTATIAWGKRENIIKSARRLVQLMDNSPFDFVHDAKNKDIERLKTFVYRTFNFTDLDYFILSLKNIYLNHNGLKGVFLNGYKESHDLKSSLIKFREIFFELPHSQRTEKHVSNISKGSSGKRLNLFLRWMVRKDKRNVDFGIWSEIPSSALYLPLDYHTSTIARKLGLLKRKQNDWKSVEEITQKLREFDPHDPVKYDFSLFGLGIFERF